MYAIRSYYEAADGGRQAHGGGFVESVIRFIDISVDGGASGLNHSCLSGGDSGLGSAKIGVIV